MGYVPQLAIESITLCTDIMKAQHKNQIQAEEREKERKANDPSTAISSASVGSSGASSAKPGSGTAPSTALGS